MMRGISKEKPALVLLRYMEMIWSLYDSTGDMTMKKGATQAVSSMNQAMMSCGISTAFNASLARCIGAQWVFLEGGTVKGRGIEAEDADGIKNDSKNDDDNRPPGRKGQASSDSMEKNDGPRCARRDAKRETR